MKGRIFVIRCTGRRKSVLQWWTLCAEGNWWWSTVHRFLQQHNSLILCADVRAVTCFSGLVMDDGRCDTDREQTGSFGSFHFCHDVSLFGICRVPPAVLPESRLMRRGETRACVHVSWISPSHMYSTHSLTRTNKDKHLGCSLHSFSSSFITLCET